VDRAYNASHKCCQQFLSHGRSVKVRSRGCTASSIYWRRHSSRRCYLTLDRGTAAGHEAWVGWLRRTKWDWFVTLTYSARANGGSADGIRRDAQEWIEALRAKCPRVYAACSFERGPHLGGWHCHVLLGGLGSHPAHRESPLFLVAEARAS
jgi:hypothetical protein